ncbi:YqbH/XkdH family protein [Bacillus sp. WP8]|uniref:YqbH/XkdH family protein n=1 Tax=Bacillus sp. WP8 TaxID=756828 RepID=UPI0021B62EEC|nr:YqbH/XkdH family protein [Bacillus sp. WP8]
MDDWYVADFRITGDVGVNEKVVWEGVRLKVQKGREMKNEEIEVVGMRSESVCGLMV